MSDVEPVAVGGLKVAKILHDFVVDEVIPGTGIEASAFWQGLDRATTHFAPRTARCCRSATRGRARSTTRSRPAGTAAYDKTAHKEFLADIGYLVPEGPPFKVDTANVDEEIATIAGPQLVVPVSNARYALNAANARWARSTTVPTASTPFRKTRKARSARVTIPPAASA